MRGGRAILRGVELELRPAETVVLMGRNGAGKSTLLRHAAGLLAPTRGSVRSSGRVALLLQNPGDYFLRERVADEAPAEMLELLGLTGLEQRHPRDLSGGERQRLALAIVMGGDRPAALALDEPTRGMDRASKLRLTGRLRELSADGTAVLVATHDVEFAAELAVRAVLMADGRVIADGPIGEVLGGGWYFTTETARVLDGAGAALLPEQGADAAAGRDRARRRGRAGGGGAVSWQLASLAIVLASVAAGVWWWERSRPPSKLLAVVATMAALAALGRDAFAAIPDVKPTTAIVLVCGVVFGARPAFAIGALAGLASNVLLGEGPWTPWQMLGWGLVGLLGAALGATLGRRPPALVLALACAFAAEVFNLVVDLYTWIGTGDHTLAGFGVVLGSAVAFDATHVIASFGFGLVFGPVLLRMLTRVRARLQVSWRPGAAVGPPRAPALPLPGGPAAVALALAAATGLALGAGAGARAAQHRVPRARAAGGPVATPAAISRELGYLASAQNADGGFGASKGQSSSELYTAWAAIGIAAAGRSPQSVRRDGHSPLDALRAEAGELHGAGDLERTILALRACGAPVRSLPGVPGGGAGGDGAGGNPVSALLALQRADGSFEEQANLSAFGVLALRAAGYAPGPRPIARAARWLLRQQERDGGFGFATRGGGSDIDDTAAVAQALAVAGPGRRAAISRAIAFLVRSQNLDGGFPQQPGGSSNAQSTSWAIQALAAAGRDVGALTRRGSRSPLGYLQSLIAPDGSVRYSRSGAQTPVWVTAQALTGLARRPFPIAPLPAAAHAAATPHAQARGRAASGHRPAPVVAPADAEDGMRTLGALLALALAPARG